MSQQAARVLAELAVERGYATNDQVQTCMNLWQAELSSGRQVEFGPFMVERGYLTAQQLHDVELAHQQKVRTRFPGYEIISKLGEGSMGVVYKARQVAMDRLVALKVLRPELARNAEYRARFMREARSTAMLNHPSIIRGIDVGEAGGLCYFVTEFIDGESIERSVVRSGAMDVRRALEVTRDVALALDHASESGLVHRDIKPENIMVTRDGETKLADLGLAKSVTPQARDATLTQVGVIWGTPNYLAPEQCRGGQNLDVRTDIYSLGVTLYFMLSAKLPFVAKSAGAILAKHLTEPPRSPDAHRPELDSGVCRIVLKMLEKQPGRRYQTGAELAAEITRYLSGGSAAERPAVQAAGKAAKRRSARADGGAERMGGGDRPARGSSRRGPDADDAGATTRARRPREAAVPVERESAPAAAPPPEDRLPLGYIMVAAMWVLMAVLVYVLGYLPS